MDVDEAPAVEEVDLFSDVAATTARASPEANCRVVSAIDDASDTDVVRKLLLEHGIALIQTR